MRQHCAAPNREYLDMLRLLLRFKASVTICANDGCNALHILADHAGPNLDLASAHLIYEAGDDAMLEARNDNQKTPYEVIAHMNATDN
jgi:hypothetical protein